MLEIVDIFLEHLDVDGMQIMYTDTGKSHFKAILVSKITFRLPVPGVNQTNTRNGQTGT